MAALTLRFLGPPGVEIDDQPVEFARRKSLALLAYLAITGEAQRRDTLATLLWPESDQSHARGSLRRELSSLKSKLNGAWLAIKGETVALCLGDDVWLDVRAFEALQETGADGSPNLARLAAAADLYRGDFLTGFTLEDCPEFDDWQFFQAEGLRQFLITALEALVDGYRHCRDFETAIGYARRRLTLDPLHEPAQRMLMCLYAESGQSAAALRQYEECLRILDEELGMPPEAETTDLYEAIRTRRFPPPHQGRSAPDRVIPSSSHNLPPQLTSFVGREEEVKAVLERLNTPECRLLTITGAGGMGKTRLALAAAEEALGHFAAGVTFVPLVGLDDPRFLSTSIADALDLPAAAGGASRREHLLTFLSGQELLLVLDGFEHLVEGAAFLTEILGAAPQVKILVTSRQPLNLREEWRYPLRGLSYPEPDAPSAEPVYAAVELFRQRAVQTDPDFLLEPNGPGVAKICRLLEGMPLGIELAAALLRTLSPAEIASELAGNIDVLSSPVCNLPKQHRSLRAVFERSWQLLSAQEQTILCHLSVFRGTFDREAAAAVADVTLPVLTALLDRSFVRRLPSGRYDLHELLRQFVAEKASADPGALEAAHQRHCAHFCGRLSRMAWCFEPEKEPEGFSMVAMAGRVSADIDNIRAAWQWAVEHRDVAAIRQAMNVLAEYATAYMPEEGRDLFDEAIAAIQATDVLSPAEAEALVGSLLLRRSWCWEWDRLPEMGERLARSLAMLRRSDPENRVDIAATLVWLGITVASLGRNEEGANLMEEGIALFRQHGHRSGMAWTLNFRGLLEAGRGRLVAARAFLEQSLELFETCKNWKWRAVARANLADVALLQGDFCRARRLYEQSLAEEDGQGEPERLICLGEVYAALGEFERAQDCFVRAEALFVRAGMPYGTALAYVVTPGVLSRLQGDPVEAEHLLVDGLATARQVGFEQRIATNLHNLSRLRHDQQRYEEAMELLEEALPIARHIDFRFATTLTLCQLGHTATALDRPEAPVYYAEALEIALDEKIDRVAVDAVRGVAERKAQAGELDRAVTLLALVRDHPASDYETKMKADEVLSELEAELPPDRFALALEQGRNSDLHAVVARLLHEEL